MLKLLGSLCILAAGGTLRMFYLSVFRRELTVLQNLEDALIEMEQEIRMNRTPIPRLMLRAGTGRCPEVEHFFQGVSEEVRSGEMLDASWRRGIDTLPIGTEKQRILRDLGRQLGGDEEKACNGIQLVSNRVIKEIQKMRTEKANYEKRSTALCFSGAALLIILLI